MNASYRFGHDAFSRFAKPNFELMLLSMAGKENLRFLEVGSYEGRSATWMLDNVLTHPSSTLTSVDNCAGVTYQRRSGMQMTDHIESTFRYNIELTGRSSQVIRLIQDSRLALPDLTREDYDFVYIDGNHEYEYVVADCANGLALVRPGGLIAFDDYGNEHLGVRQAVDEFLDTRRSTVEIVLKNWQVWVRRK